jgi:hypothetical protein
MSSVAASPLWGAICSDDTGNTHVGRAGAVEKWKWLFNLFDCVHHLHNSTKNITGLDIFKTVSFPHYGQCNSLTAASDAE